MQRAFKGAELGDLGGNEMTDVGQPKPLHRPACNQPRENLEPADLARSGAAGLVVGVLTGRPADIAERYEERRQ